MLKDKYVNTRDRSEECDELIIKLKGEVKAMKDKCVNMRDKFECGERKWSEAEEKCRGLEVEKRKLEMDLEAAVKGGDEVMEKLKASEAMKDQYKMVVLELIQRIGVLQGENREVEAKVREESEEIERILKEKMAIESQEMKCIEVLKMIEETCRHWLLEVEKRKLEMDLEAALKVGDEEVVKKMKADEVLKKNKNVDAKKMKIEEELQDWVLKLKVEEELKVCKGNGDLHSSDRKKRLKFQGFLQRIEVLEKEKGEMEAEVIKFEKEISREKEKVLNGRMMAVEAKEKNTSKLVQTIKVLENITMKAKNANKEKSEEINMEMNAYDGGSVFSPEVLDLTEDDLIREFAAGVSMADHCSCSLHVH